ncbi:MAG TPA: hypothetical protein VF168_00995 [Trueperaceae bacterium]
MSRTQGYYVRLVPQGTAFAEERGDDEPEFIMDGQEPHLFMTEAEAIEAGQTYVASRPKLTYSVEPVAP